MSSRFNLMSAPEGYQALAGVDKYLKSTDLGPLLHLIRLRVSQINGCAFCIDMHWKDARAAGETEQRLYGLDAWEESTYYTEKERAAFEWAEALTKLGEGHVPDAVFETVKQHFTGKALVDLSIAVALINAWNRLAISARSEAGKYKPPAH